MVDAVKPRLRASSYMAYEKRVRKHLIPALGHLRLTKLCPADVERMMRQQLEAGLSPRTVREVRGTLRTALNRAVKWGLVGRNAAALVDPPRQEQHEIRPLDADQAARFLDTVRHDRLSALYTVAVALGLRQGEILGLSWQDVDLDRARLSVRQQLQRIDHKLQIVPLKTEKSRRTLPLPAFAVDALRAHKVRQLEERLAAGQYWQEHGLVFTSRIGTPLDARNVIRQFKLHLQRAGLPDIRCHDLRHSAASLLLAQGVSLKEISELLGHSQISITADLYSHVAEASLRRVADTMDGILGQRAPVSGESGALG